MCSPPQKKKTDPYLEPPKSVAYNYRNSERRNSRNQRDTPPLRTMISKDRQELPSPVDGRRSRDAHVATLRNSRHRPNKNKTRAGGGGGGEGGVCAKKVTIIVVSPEKIEHAVVRYIFGSTTGRHEEEVNHSFPVKNASKNPPCNKTFPPFQSRPFVLL